MMEYELTDEVRAFCDIARDFAEGEIRPIAERLDKSENLLADFPWEMIKKGSKLGLRTLSLPKEYGGPGLGLLAWLAIIEELGSVDISCAKIFSQAWKMSRLIGQAGTKEQRDLFLPAFRDDDTFLMSGGQTEPGAGSDVHLPYDAPNAGVMLSAQRDGDEYILNGKKHFVSLAPVSKLLIIVGRTDKTVGTSKGTSAFLVPRDTPGVSFGQAHDKVGFRIYLQGEISFDDARVPAEYLLGGREGSGAHEGIASNIELAIYAAVLARTALDAALKHANESMPIGNHRQAALTKIADMYTELEVARTLLWRSTWIAVHRQADRSLTMSAKVYCTDAAVKICTGVLELFAASGVMSDSPIQKYVRDAVVLPHLDATNPINKLKITRFLDTWIADGRLPEWGRSTSGI